MKVNILSIYWILHLHVLTETDFEITLQLIYDNAKWKYKSQKHKTEYNADKKIAT